MPLSTGSRLGPYEIVAPLGAGGMGEVYRSRDTKLNRDVALKVLPEAFAADPDRLARFKREAQVLASLNHPNIAAIYGFEDSGSTHALVLELIEGPTLADRVAQGPIPLDEALPIAKQIADALEAAHEQGIIHRDLKPANIKLRTDGTVKVLDFGLAKALEPASPRSPDLTAAPTITTPAMMTGVGMILGTAAYMSPEQAKGRPADKRSDVWAFGCVLYEMLTGKRAFDGDDVGEALAAVIRAEPDWKALPSQTPSNVRMLLRRCLQKDPRSRIGSVNTAQFVLTDLPGEPALQRSHAGRWRERAAWIGALAAATGVLVFLAGRRSTEPRPLSVHFEIAPPSGEFFPGAGGVPRFSVSPDGESVVFDSSLPGQHDQLWIRRLDSPVAQPVRGTEVPPVRGIAIQQPFWSPDSRYVAFFDETASALKQVDLQSGSVQKIVSIPGNQYSGAWSPRNVIVFASTATNGVQRVSAGGGAPVQLTTVDKSRQEVSHLWPVFLPDGHHFLYHVRMQDSTRSSIYLGDLDSEKRAKVLDSDYGALSGAADVLLFIRGQSLMAQHLDVSRGELTGTPILVVDSVLATNAGRPAMSVSNNGVLVYASGTVVEARRQLVWFDRVSKTEVPVGPAIESPSLALAPDGHRVALNDVPASGALPDIWIYDIARNVKSRLTTDPGVDAMPIWSPDGSRIVFVSNRKQVWALYEAPASGSVPERELLAADPGVRLAPHDWSADGRTIVFGRGRDIFMLAIDGDRKPVEYLKSPFVKLGSKLAPNGRWLAYASDEAGTYQVFVQSFPDASRFKWQVSSAGGTQPRWNRNGHELFYLDGTGRVMAVPVTTEGTFTAGQPTSLFEAPLAAVTTERGNSYDVSADSRRFLLSLPMSGTTSPPLSVIVNWRSRLLAQATTPSE